MAKVVCKNSNEIFYVLFGNPYSSVFNKSRFGLQSSVKKNGNGRFVDTRMLDLDYYDGWRDNEHHITTKSCYHVLLPFFSLILKTFEFDQDNFIEVPFFSADFKHDVSYLKPKADMRFTMDINGKNVGSGLTFEEIQNINYVNSDAAYYSEYHRLFRGSHTCCVVVNETIENDNRIFISGDSMVIPLLPIFCCYYKELVFMDNRDGISHKEYYEGKTFDEVLLCFFEGSIFNKVLGINLQ